MVQYINKSALVAEIERIKKEECPTDSYEGRCKLLWFEQFLSFLDAIETKEVGFDLGDPNGDKSSEYIVDTKTLEVKEVDLERELDAYTADNFWALEGNNESPYLVEKDDMLKVAKHLYGLGLRAKDVNEIIKTAEDHAYFVGSENTREKLIDKACKWWEEELSYPSMTPEEIRWYKNKVNKFRKAMEE